MWNFGDWALLGLGAWDLAFANMIGLWSIPRLLILISECSGSLMAALAVSFGLKR